MLKLKKALSLILCMAMMLTMLCFSPSVTNEMKANAAVTETDGKTAFYVPEVIYLYPNVKSWNSETKTPFLYYVGNTVNTENIYSAPTVEAKLDTVGKVYFAALDGMNDVTLSAKFLDSDFNYIPAESTGSVTFSETDMTDYRLFTVTEGVSPKLSADKNGAYIEWCLTYKNNDGEQKALFNYTYVYKPYVVPYGALTRVNNTKGQVSVFGQHITWVTGVHSVDTTPQQNNTLYPNYTTVSSETSDEFAFSPFLSKTNKAYVGETAVEGAANVDNGGYYAVFSSSDPTLAYFHAGQSGAEFTKGIGAATWFTSDADASDIYPVAFDYILMSPYTTGASGRYVFSQVTPTKLGTVNVDISRYDNLNEVPNLAVGMMLTDVDYNDAYTQSVPTAQWYVGDATGLSHLDTSVSLDSKELLDSVKAAVNEKFASQDNVASNTLTLGIKYAGAWDKAIDKSVATKVYTVKGYYESEDRDGDRQAASASVSLNVNQVDKTSLRAAVNNAVSYFGILGVKSNWNSSRYDIKYVDAATGVSVWDRFVSAYKNAAAALTQVDATPDCTALANELNSALNELLSGKGLRVYFDVNYDGIGVNLWINPISSLYIWNSENETATINGTFEANAIYGVTSFTPDAASYTFSAEKISGTFNGVGCSVFDSVDENGNNAMSAESKRYNFDFAGTDKKVLTYDDTTFANVDGIKFWTWYYQEVGSGIYDNFTLRLKIEKGSEKTAYSPAGKVTGSVYGTLPVPTREGYTFAGWFSDAACTEEVTATSSVGARILYAKWEKNTYSVVFDGNTNTSGTMSEQSFTYDESGNLNENLYSKTGYVFDSWKDADGNTYSDKQSVINLTSEKDGKVTLFAQWVPNHHTVSFNANGGNGNMDSVPGVYDTPLTLPENTFTKTGYTFGGWALTGDGKAEFEDKATVSNLTSDVDGNVTLYAVWIPNVFTVNFNKNTGTGEMSSANVTYDSNVKLPECTFTKTGYTFAGWATAADSKILLTDSQYSTLKENNGDSITLYAIWTENSYTLNFDSNGGEGTKIEPHVYSYEYEIVLPKNVFTKVGYELAGWSLTKDGELKYENGASVKQISPDKDGNVTLYAVWTPVNYTISFDANTGTESMANVTATYDELLTLPANSFKKTGYHFVGWALTADGKAVYDDKAQVKNLTETKDKTVTLYAIWEINTYKVTFKYYNTAGTYVTTDVNVKHGSNATLPTDFTTTPYKDTAQHYVFSKWDIEFSNVVSDLTVKALYKGYESHDMAENDVPSTCQTAGYIRHYCTKCSHYYDVSKPIADHAWDDGKTAEPAGCVSTGSFVYECKNCHMTKASPIDPLGHNFETVTAAAATCKKVGNIEHKLCTRCNNRFSVDAEKTAPMSEALKDSQVFIEKLPHIPGSAATCTTAQTCTVCGDVLIKALGHTEKTEYTTTEATCVKDGNYTKTVTCTVCHEVISTENLYGKVPHNYSETVVPPTCTDAGYTKFTCSVCGDNYTGNTVAANGHSEGIWKTTTQPKCLEKGEETNYCSACGTGYKTRDVKALGHDDGEWKNTTKAKCEEWGEDTLYCTRCSQPITTRSVQPTGHVKTHTEETLSAGCESSGKLSTICDACGEELSFVVIPEKGHSLSGTLSCETDVVCSNCEQIMKKHYGHKWDSGQITKEPTETEKGILTYTCLNDSNHKKTEPIPVKIIIALPDIESGKSYVLKADENGSGGNIFDIVSVSDEFTYTVESSDTSILSIAPNGKITVYGDGDVTITVKTSDSKHQKSFPVTAKTLKTIIFKSHEPDVTKKLYVGDTVTPPEVPSYTENGFVYAFVNWTVDGQKVTDFTVKGDTTFVAVYTAPCDYTKLDKLSTLFADVISGKYDNADELRLYKNEIAACNADIEKFAADRNTRDVAEQTLIDAAATNLSGLISKLYPEENATVEIRGNTTLAAGTSTQINAYMLPLETEVLNGVWTSSDESVGFFANGKFYAVAAGTTTVTVTVGVLSTSVNITVAPIGNTSARVIMFDSLLTNANYIVENTFVVKSTVNMFWAPDADVHFRVITDGTFEEYYVYVNNVRVTPDENGVYTILANTGDAHVRIDGVVKDQEGEKLSFWDALIAFFKKIGDFFRNLFGG